MVQTGVPQGSILGPLLFLIYINDLHQISENMCPTMFADDTSFFISRPHLDEIMDTANAELDKVYQWLIQNRLSLNVKKSKYIIFNKTKTKILYNIALTINNKPIERVKQFKFLGYHLDETLSWKVHICEIASKIAKNIGLLSKLRKPLNSSTLRNLYFSLIHVYINNGLIVWGSATKSYIDQILKLQKKTIRIINYSGPKEHTAPLFKCHRLLPISKHYTLNCALFMFKVHHGLHPQVIINLFNKKTHSNSFITRQQQHYIIPKSRCKTFEASIAIQGPKCYNQLFNNFNINRSIHTYKRHILSHLLEAL